MQFIADLHIHSRFSMATSRDCNPENLHKWARLKGLTLVGTGDFTHPGWFGELREKLEPAEEGLYRLKPELEDASLRDILPEEGEVRFVVSGEISSIYKKNGRTRKIHNLIILPSLEAAEVIDERLDKIGNIRSDGRPILGLDSYHLLELVMEACPEATFIPAHIWTPHFSLFGASSGFDDIEECFEDLTPHIFAVETGLSSDPPMNWRLGVLDNYAIISNSDAHSPPNLAREANLFDTELSYPAVRDALRARDPKRFLGTLEFFPEEGKYHYDGHRNCGVRWKPSQTMAAGGLCPVCGKKVTIGVLHRVEALADRPDGARPEAARHFESLVPLAEVIGAALGVGKGTKTVARHCQALVRAAGSELAALRTTPLQDLAKVAGPVATEGIRRVRTGELDIAPGFDGEYGRIGIFQEGERAYFEAGGTSLFGDELPESEERDHTSAVPEAGSVAEAEESYDAAQLPLRSPAATAPRGPLDSLNDAQREAVTAEQGPVVVVAGPGTGKTHTLTCRAAYLIRKKTVPAESIMAVTFTNKAADEMRTRLRGLLAEMSDDSRTGDAGQGSPGEGRTDAAQRSLFDGVPAGQESAPPPAPEGEPVIGTFHSICLDVLQKRASAPLVVLDGTDARTVLQQVLKGLDTKLTPRKGLDAISLLKSRGLTADSPDVPEELQPVYQGYQSQLVAYGALDYDDILLNALHLFQSEEAVLGQHRSQFSYLLADEFQDVNAVQYELVKLWAGDGANLFVIGDPDQAIYGFRGADHRFFGRLGDDFPSARSVSLTTSYRSVTSILQAASAAICKNPDRAKVKLKASRGGGMRPRHLEVASETAEGIAIVREVGRMVGGATMLQADGEREARTLGAEPDEGRSFSDIAVLFRTSRQADKLEECFIREGVPYRVVGQRSFLESKNAREALTFFRCVLNPDDRFRYLQCLGLGRFDSTRKIAAAVSDSVAGIDGPIEPWLRNQLAAGAYEMKIADKLRGFLETMEDYRAQTANASAEGILARWMEEGDLQEDEDLKRLLRLASSFDDLRGFLNRVLLCQDAECERSDAPSSEAVTLMTLHAAKGTEFPVVFIAGVEEGLIPIRGADAPEERRLFYVGLTRGRDEVILLSTRSRVRYGKTERPSPSRFLRDIPDRVLAHTKVELKRKPPDKQMKLF